MEEEFVIMVNVSVILTIAEKIVKLNPVKQKRGRTCALAMVFVRMDFATAIPPTEAQFATFASTILAVQTIVAIRGDAKIRLAFV